MFGDISSRPRKVRNLLSVLAVLVALNAYMFARSVWQQRSLANAAVPLMTLAVPPVPPTPPTPPTPPAMAPPDIDQRRHFERRRHVRRHRCRNRSKSTAISLDSESDVQVRVIADYDGAFSNISVDIPDVDLKFDIPDVNIEIPDVEVEMEDLELNLDLDIDELDKSLEDLRREIESLSDQDI